MKQHISLQIYKSAEWHDWSCQTVPRTRIQEWLCVLSGPPTDLLVDHVTHGHSDLHACSLDMEEVEVMEQRQTDAAYRQGRGVAQAPVESSTVPWVVIFKVPNQQPQDDWLDHFNDFLICREGDEGWTCECEVGRLLTVNKPQHVLIKICLTVQWFSCWAELRSPVL